MTDYWKQFTVVDEHNQSLGGNLRHGDTRAITPGFWKYMVDRFGARSLLDIGAGEGQALRAFHRLGVVAHGFDALHQNIRNSVYPMALHDLTMGPYIFRCDMVHCVELAEHIKEQFLTNIMNTMMNAPIVMMTHGTPGQPGHHHVNNQPEEYWIEKFNACGYSLSMDNDLFRKIARNEVADSYFAISGLVFLKRFQ